MTDYYLPAKANGDDFRDDVGVNYHNAVGGDPVSPTNPMQGNHGDGFGVFNDGTMRACTTARGAIWLAGVFAHVYHFSDLKFYRVTGTPVATLTISEDLGTVNGFTSLTVAEEYTTAELKDLAGMPENSNEIW